MNTPKQVRDIRSNNPRAVTTYITCLHKYLCDQNFFSRLQKLNKERNHFLAERLDNCLAEGSLYAANKCPAIRQEWWSPDLHRSLQRKKILEAHRRKLRNKKDVTQVMHESGGGGDRVVLPPTVEETNKEIKAVKRQIEIIRRNSVHFRDQHLQKLAEKASTSGDLDKAMELSQMRHREATAENRPEACKWWRTVDMPKDLEVYFLQRNTNRFGQQIDDEGITTNNNNNNNVLKEVFDWEANSIISELVLYGGNYSKDELDDLSGLLHQHCQHEYSHPIDYECTITVDEYSDRLKKWHEKQTTTNSTTTTSSSSSSGLLLHLGHAKALIARHDLDPMSDEGIKISLCQKAILQGRVDLINYSTTYRDSYSRWKEKRKIPEKIIINVTIEKEEEEEPSINNNNKIHRLRVIHLYENDHGAYLALHWKKAVENK